jgi:hypothetical protein
MVNKHAATAILWIATAAAIAHAQTRPIKGLTPERLQAAVAEGQSGQAQPPVDLVLARMSRGIFLDRDGQAADASALLQRIKDAPFYITLLTPYMRVTSIVAEAKRRFADPPQFSADTLNAEGLLIHVSEGGNFLEADVVDDLVIKKGEQIIRPTKKQITPSMVQNRAGASKPSATGEFYFALDTIPDAPFQIVCVGKGGNYYQTVVADDLFALK